MVLKDIQYSDIIYYCFLISIFESLLVLPMTISRLNEKPSLYIIISISNLGINLLLQLYFIVIKNYDFGYVFLAKTIAPAVIFIIFIPYVIKNIFAKINFEDVKSILKFSFPLMLAAAFGCDLAITFSEQRIITPYIHFILVFPCGISASEIECVPKHSISLPYFYKL